MDSEIYRKLIFDDDHFDWANKRKYKCRLLHNNLVYVYYIPKSASTTILDFLSHKKYDNSIIEQCTLNDCKVDNSMIYSIVRDPIKRLISGYISREHCLGYKQNENKTIENFKIFLDKLFQINQYKVNVHFTPQFILMNEDINHKIYNIRDFSLFEKNVFETYGYTSCIKQLNKSTDTTTMKLIDFVEMTPNIKHKIKQYYDLDYKNLAPFLVRDALV